MFLYVNTVFVCDMKTLCVCVCEFVLFPASTLCQTSNTIPTLIFSGGIESQHCALQCCQPTSGPPQLFLCIFAPLLQTQDMHVLFPPRCLHLGKIVFQTLIKLSCFSCICLSPLWLSLSCSVYFCQYEHFFFFGFVMKSKQMASRSQTQS